jgi:transposase
MISVDTWMEIRRLNQERLSQAEIARRLELNRRTVRKALREKQPPVARKPRVVGSILDPFKDHIRARLRDYNLSAVRLLEEIRQKGYAGEYTVVKEFVREVKDQQAVRAVVRFESQPGGQGQVDWAHFGTVTLDGEERKLSLFTMILGWSRMRYVEWTLDMSTPTLIRCHLNAFQFFGGYPEELLYDNLKQVVLERGADSSSHRWNSQFADFAKHYDFTPRLCRPYRAQTKGKIENNVKFVRGNFFEGRSFTSLQDINAQGIEWCRLVAQKPHGTTHEPPARRLPLEGLRRLEDKPAYVIVQTFERKVSRECFVSYHGNRYSVPWKHASRACLLRVREDKIVVEIAGKTVAEHALARGSHQVVRVKEHFDGLLKAIRDRPSQPQRRLVFPDAPQVEQRELHEYERILDSFQEASP